MLLTLEDMMQIQLAAYLNSLDGQFAEEHA